MLLFQARKFIVAFNENGNDEITLIISGQDYFAFAP
jgi:hypothetical protein